MAVKVSRVAADVGQSDGAPLFSEFPRTAIEGRTFIAFLNVAEELLERLFRCSVVGRMWRKPDQCRDAFLSVKNCTSVR